MAEGTSTWEGGGLPREGEFEIVAQTAANDIVTITGATSHTGDFIVGQNSTGAELAIIDINGGAHFAGASSFASTLTVTGALTLGASVTGTQHGLVVSATTMSAGLTVSVTSTGALNALGTAETMVNGIVIAPSSKAVMNAALFYAGGSTTTVNTAIALLAVAGANSGPSYFLAFGTSGGASAANEIYKGAHSGDHDFVDASMLINTFTCDHPFVGLKCLSGSQTIYILAVHATGIT